MGKVTPIYSYYTLQQGDIVYPYFDETNMVTTDNQFGGLYGFVGTGIISGWEVTKLSSDGSYTNVLNATIRNEQINLIDGYIDNADSYLGRRIYSMSMQPRISCAAATTAALNATYNNGAGTLTNAGTQAAFSIDDVTLTQNQYVIVKNQTGNEFQNGVYQVSTVGTVSSNWVLTRAAALNTSQELADAKDNGYCYWVSSGTQNQKTIWTPNLNSTSFSLGSSSIRFQNAFEQCVRVTTGNGIVGLYKAYTEENNYFRYFEENLYYVWASSSVCLASEGKCTIISPLDPDYDYDKYHTATYLATVQVASYTGSNGVNAYVDLIDYDDRRNQLLNLSGAFETALRKSFYRHVHLGGINHPSKINLSTVRNLVASGPIGTTIFLIYEEDGVTRTAPWDPAIYGIPEVRLNNAILPSTAYTLNATTSKIYLKNSLQTAAYLQISLPLSPQVKLTIRNGSNYNDAVIVLTDGSTDTNGNQNIYRWDSGLFLDPLVYLDGILVSSDLYAMNPGQGTIKFDTALTSPYTNASLEIILEKIGREITGTLPGSRLENVGADLFTKGVIDPRRIAPLDHVGQVRYLETALYTPYKKLLSSGDHQIFYPELTGQDLQYTTDVLKLQKSNILNTVMFQTKRGLMQSNSITLVNLGTWNTDNGQVIFVSDDILRSSEGSNGSPSYVSYVLTNKGTVYFTVDQGSTWQKLPLPVETTSNITSPVFATALIASTDKESFDNNGAVDYKYSTSIYLGTTTGLYKAFAYRGQEFTWSNVWDAVSEPKQIYALEEIVTQRKTVQSGVTTENYDRTLYISSDKGFTVAPSTGVYSSLQTVSAEIPKGFLWIKGFSANDLLWFTDTKVYISHTARLVEENPDSETSIRYWTHPLSGWNSTRYTNRISCAVATTVNLSATYSNAGSSSTLTNNGTQAALKIDGYTLTVSDKVLVKDQTNAAHNGIYTVTSIGSGSTNWVLTRTNTYDETKWAYVTSGSSWARSLWTSRYSDNNSDGNFDYDIDPLIIEEFWVNPVVLASSTYPFKDAIERAGTNIYVIVSTANPYIFIDSKSVGLYDWEPVSVYKGNWNLDTKPLINAVYNFSSTILLLGTKSGIYKCNNPSNLKVLTLSSDLAPADTEIFVTNPQDLEGYDTVQVVSGSNSETLTIDVNSTTVDGITSYTIDITSGRTSVNTYAVSNTNIYILEDGFRLTDASWIRPLNIFNSTPVLQPYYEDQLAKSSDGTQLLGEVDSALYSLSVDDQSLKFASDQTIGQSFIFENDYINYYTMPWATDANAVVYINNDPATVPYGLYPSEGRITFLRALDSTKNVKITIIKYNAYLSNVGVNPHGEQPNSLVSSDNIVTSLSATLPALSIAGTGITVADPLAIPLGTSLIELRNSLLSSSEILQVKVQDTNSGSRYISLVAPRSGTLNLPITSTKLYTVSLQSIPGIEDKISLEQSNQYYHFNSVSGANLAQLCLTADQTYNNLFNNFNGEPDPIFADKASRGLVNSLFYDFSLSESDSRNSSSTRYIGLEPSASNVSVAPKNINFIYNPSYAGSNTRLGTDKGIWKYNGSYWEKESSLDGANSVYFIKSATSLIAGTDIGLFEQQDDLSWAKNATYPQAVYDYISGSWDTNYTFEAYGKSDGLAFVRTNSDGSFVSDHFDDLDESNIYGLHQNKFFRFVGTGENRKQTQVDALYLCTNVGLYAVCTGNASNRGQFAEFLVGREMFGSNPNNVVIETPNGSTLQVPVKYYKIFQSPRPKSVPLIILSSNGVYTVRNWRWCDPDDSQEDLKDFVVESHNLQGIPCYSFATATETTSVGETVYKIFVGTNQGVYRSFDEAKTFERCERVNGQNLTINDIKSISSTCLVIGTNNGNWYSNDDGDTWYRTDEAPSTGSQCVNWNRYVEAAKLFNGGSLGQTFKPDSALNTEIVKVSLFLDRNEVESDDPSLDNTIEVALYSTTGGLPTGSPLATTAYTTNSAYYATGYQATSGFSAAPRLYDNDIYDTSTYYESTNSLTSGPTLFAALTAKYDLGSSKPVDKIIAKIYYTQDPFITIEYSDDDSTWTAFSLSTIDPPIHGGSGRWESLLTVDSSSSGDHRYWRLSIKDDPSDLTKTRVARIGDFRMYFNSPVGEPDEGKLKQHVLPEIFTAGDINYPGFKSFIINVTGLTPSNTYALVATETVGVGATSIIKWIKSNVEGY